MRACTRCDSHVEFEKELDYPYYCPECDENMFEFETKLINKEELKSIETQPGLEMDAMVAKNVLGWKYSTLAEYAHLKLSTTWEGMRKVIDEMRRQGKLVSIIDNGDSFDVKFEGQSEYTRESSLPHAVCVAAMLTVLPSSDANKNSIIHDDNLGV